MKGKANALSQPCVMSNQRKSRKNKASSLKAYARPAIFSFLPAWNFLLIKLL
jgi:hypothetical protein